MFLFFFGPHRNQKTDVREIIYQSCPRQLEQAHVMLLPVSSVSVSGSFLFLRRPLSRSRWSPSPLSSRTNGTLKLFEEDGSLISKHRQIFVIVPTTHKTKKVAQTFCAGLTEKKFRSLIWKYNLTFHQTLQTLSLVLFKQSIQTGQRQINSCLLNKHTNKLRANL